MIEKTLVIAAGEKGGVGKSLALTVVIEGAYRRGLRTFLVEGDPSIPDVQRRYQGCFPGVKVSLNAPDQAADAIVTLFDHLEAVLDDYDVVAINLPSGAAATVDSQAETLILPCLEAFKLNLAVLFPLGPSQDSVDCLAHSWSQGLCAIAQRAMVLPNAFFGDPGRFIWQHSALRQQWLEPSAVRSEQVLPRMVARVAEKMRPTHGYWWDWARGTIPGLNVVERAALYGWLRETDPVSAWALGQPTWEQSMPQSGGGL